jgi:hypothetical protein
MKDAKKRLHQITAKTLQVAGWKNPSSLCTTIAMDTRLPFR